MKKVTAILLLIALGITGCTKDDANLTVGQLLSAQKWTFEGATSTDPDVSTLLPLLTGATLTFATDFTYTMVVQGISSGSGSGNPNTWELSSDNKQIIFNKNQAEERTVTIILLERSSLHYQETDGVFTTDYYWTKR